MLTKETIVRELAERQETIRGFGATGLDLFGSFARGEQGPGSDLDFLVEFAPGRGGYDDYFGLLLFLQDLFARQVDLVKRHLLRPEVKPFVFKDQAHGQRL